MRWRCACSGTARRRVGPGQQTALQSILKLLGSEAAQPPLELLETLGPDVVLDRERPSTPPHNPWHLDIYIESWFNRYVRSFAMTIAGGTEIQRTSSARLMRSACRDERADASRRQLPARIRACAAQEPDAVVRHAAPDGSEASLTARLDLGSTRWQGCSVSVGLASATGSAWPCRTRSPSCWRRGLPGNSGDPRSGDGSARAERVNGCAVVTRGDEDDMSAIDTVVRTHHPRTSGWLPSRPTTGERATPTR
jgi:hypothetical protein